MVMKIVSWNVAGLRARMKNNQLMRMVFASPNEGYYQYFDIVCLQETKCTPDQINLPCEIDIRYPYRFWKNSMGTTQRRGFSGTCIWSKIKPVRQLTHYDFDEEGRTVALEFDDFVLVNVYVPNSQKVDSDREIFRREWDVKFRSATDDIKKNVEKPVIICGDLNVARTDNDIVDPHRKRNCVPGFLDSERSGIEMHLETLNIVDVFRERNPELRASTYWSNFLKQPRSSSNGWRIDYFLASREIYDKITDLKILSNADGSDHCPIVLEM